MTRTVKDAAILLGALTGMDAADAATAESEGKALKDYMPFLDAHGLQGKRIGVEKSFLKGHEGVDALLQKALEQMKTKGANIVEVEMMKMLKVLDSEEINVFKIRIQGKASTGILLQPMRR